ncbi:uncharacterized protein EV422DRAFT_508262 [Fimicolochytrium jonesii]|uniref:uncharacterized protein n=1 Tax=Fimicolochytrium jonesii TaxID=1396493 RepID=UPI0022FE1809|nr:uncharacterized protein EV422DRAFT_508262 [Fimicolochytrium jonesii]KAI8818399.1 hypothetical protein EV422DRAFT_508262 [Fimicolochytrium jonesii]
MRGERQAVRVDPHPLTLTRPSSAPASPPKRIVHGVPNSKEPALHEASRAAEASHHHQLSTSPRRTPQSRPTSAAHRGLSPPLQSTISSILTNELPKKLPPATPGTLHRRYSPVYKCANRLLAKRWDDTANRRHREKIASMKPAIDNKPPQKCSHLDMRLKKMRQEQERANRIQEENLILLNRMARQMQAPRGFSNVDSKFQVKPMVQKPSPSSYAKRRQIEELQEANEVLHRRLASSHPVYSREAWHEDRRRNLIYFANTTKYPETYAQEFEKEGLLSSPLVARVVRSQPPTRAQTPHIERDGAFRHPEEEEEDEDSGDDEKTPGIASVGDRKGNEVAGRHEDIDADGGSRSGSNAEEAPFGDSGQTLPE